MALKIITVICLLIVASRHLLEFKNEKANEILNGISFSSLIILAFCLGV